MMGEMSRDGCCSAILVTKLFVRASLPNFLKAMALKMTHDFAWF